MLVSVVARTAGVPAISKTMIRSREIFPCIHERCIITSIPVTMLFKRHSKKQFLERKWIYFDRIPTVKAFTERRDREFFGSPAGMR
jgi:hypothetical protein